MIVRCRHCGRDVEAPPDAAGRRLRCPECGKTFLCRLPRATVVDDQTPPDVPESLLLEEEVAEEAPPQEPPTAPADEVAAALDSPEAPRSSEDALARLGEAVPKTEVRESPRQWYVIIDGVAAVALTYGELVARAGEGKIKPRNKIYYAPKDLTVPARDIPGLFPQEDAKRAERAARGKAPARTRAAQDIADALRQLEGQGKPPDRSDQKDP